jgi:transposase
LLARLTTKLTPQLVDEFGVGPDTATEMLIVACDNADAVADTEARLGQALRRRSHPASSGLTTRHRLNRGRHRRANAALYGVVIGGMQHHASPRAYVARCTAEGKTKRRWPQCVLGVEVASGESE